MKRRLLSWAVVLLAVPAPAADAPPTSIRLLARPALDEATKTAIANDAKEAAARLEALRAELEGRLGKKRNKWPAEEQERFKAAEQAEERAADRLWYAGNVQQDMDDTLRDLTEAIGKKKRLRITTDEKDADLIVEIMGRSRGRHGGQLGQSSHLAMVMKSGPRIDPAAVLSLKMEFTAGLKRRIPVFESETPPAVALEIVGNGIGWRFSTTMAADELDYMVKKNQEILKPAGAP